MGSKVYIAVLVTVFICAWFIGETDAWAGNYYNVRYSRTYRERYCACWYRWWGCSYYRYYWRTTYYYISRCRPGWTHNGNYNCVIPTCSPTCQNGGTCVKPNSCDCPSTSQGPGCRQLTCSYKRPCYPGECESNEKCKCEAGFRSESVTDGCIIFDNSTLAPIIGKSKATLADVRRSDNKTNFMFVMDGTMTDTTDIIWSNQNRFNTLKFEFEASFVPPDDLPERPLYVHEAKMGVAESQIKVNVSKIPRDGGAIRDPGSDKKYSCQSGFSRDNPAMELATCEINDDQFRTLIEHGDWLTVAFQTNSGGFQQLTNTDRNQPYDRKYYIGLQDIKQVEFRFDFIAPTHCFEAGACLNGEQPLRVEEEFTKKPIKVKWSGWTDALSGVWEYYVEVFKLSPDPYKRLIEMKPLQPLFNITIQNEATMTFPEYRPDEPGMYSVLMETRDTSNNSKITRRLVLFDDESKVSINTASNSKLYISSAVAETGYMWQTTTSGKNVTITVNWANHFINHIHEDEKLLNVVEDYPIQFNDIQDDGVLYSQKFVNTSLDDNEGKRTKSAIANYHGIIKFEMAKVHTLEDSLPDSGWQEITPLGETTKFTETLGDGSRVKVWLRATDSMGNQNTDNTTVYFDASRPRITSVNSSASIHNIILNVEEGLYNYTSRISFGASDLQSGVHKIEYRIVVHTEGKKSRTVYSNSTSAATGKSGEANCIDIQGVCFISQQRVDVDNCWFMVDRSDLDKSSATVEITAYNQALLTTQTTFEVGKVTKLKGLEEYSGPKSLRVEQLSDRGFRIAWDLPENLSCYGIADIVVRIFKTNSNGETKIDTYYTSGTSTHFDVLSLDASTEYTISLGLRVTGGQVTDTGTSLKARTKAEQVDSEGTSVGVIVGVSIGVIALVAIILAVFFMMIRRGYIHPAAKARTIKRAVTQKYRQTVYGDANVTRSHTVAKSGCSYDNRLSELYIYGGIDDGPQGWQIDRNDITFENLIKTGHFANIYKAQMRGNNGRQEVVVAKTLKERFSSDDEVLMKAKINFIGRTVGDNPNVLRFVGAVISDEAMGSFIIYEYCEHGTLKDYLVESKNNMTLELQECLFRFGLDIAKGMEYLAAKGIVHKRLAARNILLTFLNEVKISGFGPQPAEEDEGDAELGKKERIPIKWVAPECMSSTKDATEQSDVWSYAVVLWEIFTLGDTPYQNIQSRDLLTKLKRGERLPKPKQCDDTWYGVMTRCWALNANKRPAFTDIRNELDSLFVAAPGDDYYYYQR